MPRPRVVTSLQFFLQEFPRQTAAMVCALLLAGIMESVGAVGLIPLLGGLLNTGPADPLLEKTRQVFLACGLEPSLGVVLIIICGAMLAKSLFSLFAFRQVGYVVAEVTTRFRLTLLDCVLKAPWGFFVSRKAGSLTNALSYEASQAGDALRTIALFLANLLQALAYLVAGLFISWRILVVGLLLGGVFFFLFRRLLSIVHNAGKRQVSTMERMMATFTDALAGAKPLKVMGMEESFVRHIRIQAEHFKQAMRQFVLGTELLRSFQEPALTVCVAGGIFFASQTLHMGAAPLLAMAFFFHRILSRVSAAQQALQSYLGIEGALFSLREKIKSIQDSRASGGGTTTPAYAREISLRSVVFRHEDREVLHGLDLTIPFGRVTALCGPSGSGKTTVADLLPGLLRPNAGEVYLDGVPLGEIDVAAWRSHIGYVPQEVFLFHDTVLNNITLGDAGYSEQDVWEMLEAVGMRETIAGLPSGLAHVVGEQGRTLSGGQRQRLMIARALIRKPLLLILDEATTGLDEATERDILRTLKRLRGSMAIFAVSHQPAMREIADHIYVMSDGKAEELCESSPQDQQPGEQPCTPQDI